MAFFSSITVDPVLAEQLKKRGKTQELADLENAAAQTGPGPSLKAGIKQVITPFGGVNRPADQVPEMPGNNLMELGRKGLDITGGKKIAASGGAALAMPYIQQQMEEVQKNQTPLLQTALKQLRDPALSKERKQEVVNLINQINPDIVAQIPDLQRGAKEIFGDAAQLALTATLGLSSPLSEFKLAGFVDTEALKELNTLSQMTKTMTEAERIGKYGKVMGTILNQAANRGVQITKNFLLGAGFFGAYSAAENQSFDEMKKQALQGGIINVLVPPVLEGVVLGGKLAAEKAYGSFIGPTAERIMGRLESIAAGPTQQEMESSASTITDKILSGVKSEDTFKQKAAQTALNGIQWFKDLEQKWLDRFAPLKRAQQAILDNKGMPLTDREEVYYNARLADSRANASADFKLADLFGDKNFGIVGKLEPLKDVERDIKARWVVMDQLDRLNRGLPITGGKTKAQLEKDLAEHIGAMTATGKEAQVQEGVELFNQHFRNELNADVKAGLIKQTEADAMLEAHPNYLPHSVVLDADEKAIMELQKKTASGGSLNVADNAYKEAIGSLRKIDDPYAVTIRRQYAKERLREYNKIWQGLAQAQEDFGQPVAGMRPVKTAAMVEKRAGLMEEMVALKQEKSQIEKQLSQSTKKDNKLVARMRALQKELDELNQEAIAVATSPEADEIESKLLQQLKTTESPTVVHHKIVSEEEALKQSIRARVYGDTGAVFDVQAKNVQTLKQVLEEAGLKEDVVQEILDKTEPGILKQGRVTISSKNVGPSAKSAIEDLLVRAEQKDPALEKLKNKISFREEKIAGLEGKKATGETTIDQLITDLEGKKEQLKEAWIDLQKVKTPLKKLSEETISFYRNGVKETWIVPHDLALMAKNLGSEKIAGFAKILVGANNLMKQFSTSKNLSFSIPNLLRDKQTAAATADAFIRSMVESTGAVPRVVDMNKKELYKMWIREGGEFASILKEGKVEQKFLQNLEEKGVVRQLGEKVNPVKAVEWINQNLEENTRLQVFRKALEAGLDPKQAALVSRDATVDFGKMGYVMKNVNQVIPFLNARTQGLLNIPKAVLADPQNFARIMQLTAVYPSMVLYQHNRQFKSYENISPAIKNKYWVIMTGEEEGIDRNGNPYLIPKFVTIPKGEIQSLVGNPVQYFLEKSDKLDNRTTGQMLTDTLLSASPLTFQGFDSTGNNIMESLISNLGPGATVPYGLASNRDPFYQQTIIPESRLNVAKELQANKTTPQILKDAAKIMNVSPAMLEFTINSFGGVPQDLVNIMNLTAGEIQEGKLRTNPLEPSPFGQASRMPILRRFLRESSQSQSPSRQAQEQLLGKVEQEVNTNKLRIKDKADEIYSNIINMDTPAERQAYFKSLNMDYATKKALYNRVNYARTIEVLTPNMSNEVKARYIWLRLQEMQKAQADTSDITDYLQRLKDRKILTTDVLKMLQVIRFMGQDKLQTDESGN